MNVKKKGNIMHSNKTENKREDILKANEIAALAVDQFNNEIGRAHV